MKTFDEFVKEVVQKPREVEMKKEDLEEKPHIDLQESADEIGCLICNVLKALGLSGGFDDYKPSRLEHMLGGNSEIIITMGGPEKAYDGEGFLDVIKDVIGTVDKDKKYTAEDIKEIRKDKSKHGASMKKLLALMDDDHVLRAFNGMQLFKAGGNIQKAQEGEQIQKPTVEVKIGNNTYHLWEAKTTEEKKDGLKGVKELNPDQGMIFYYDEPQSVQYWMQDTLIPLKICFFNEDFECISVKEGHPLSEELITEDDVQFVVELRHDADVKPGDELDLPGDDDEYVMEVLGSDGGVQYQLKSGQRIMSRKSTKVIITKAKRAWKNRRKPAEYEKYCASLGRYVFNELDAQDGRKAEYVQLDKDKK